MEYRQALPVGAMLEGDYRIQSVLGQGGFGLTYKADELRLHQLVAIKEYFPGDLALRERGSTVVARSARDEDVFEWGRAKFLEEARTLARFRHPNIVRVARLFEANNTAYMVLDFEMGPSLAQWRASLGRAPSQGEIDAISSKLLDAVGAVHKAGLLHRDIKPANIIMRDSTEPVLIDFGAARQALSAQSRTVHAIVTPGYSPKEQYAVDLDRQGAWSDIYALGATLYFLITGKAPPDALSRDLGDTMAMEEKTTSRYRAALITTIEHALRVRAEDRPQSVDELRGLLAGDGETEFAVPSARATTAAASGLAPSTRATPASRAPAGLSGTTHSQGPKRVTFEDLPPGPASRAEPEKRGGGLVVSAVIAGVLILAGLWYWIGFAAPARDEAAWERALAAGTVESFDQYVREQPSGRHIADAQARRQQLAGLTPRSEQSARPDPAAEARPTTPPAAPTPTGAPAPAPAQGPTATPAPTSAQGPTAPPGPTAAPAPTVVLQPAAPQPAPTPSVVTASPTPLPQPPAATPSPTQQAAARPSPPPAQAPRAKLPEALSQAELTLLARSVPAAKWRLSILPFAGEKIRGYTDQQSDLVATLAQLSGNKLVATALTGTDNVARAQLFERLKTDKDLIAWHAPLFEAAQHGEFSVFSGAVPFGLAPADHVRWMRDDGWHLLEQAYANAGHSVRAIPCGVAGGPGGWFRKEIRSPADLNGLRIVTGRIMGAALRSLGAPVVSLRSRRELIAAYTSNRIDAVAGVTPLLATFAGATRLAPVYHYPGVHNPSYMFDLLIGAETWGALAEPQRRLLHEACRRNLDRWATVFPSSQNDVLNRIRAQRVTVLPFTGPVREALRKAADTAIAGEAAKSPAFKTVIDSYNRFRR